MKAVLPKKTGEKLIKFLCDQSHQAFFFFVESSIAADIDTIGSVSYFGLTVREGDWVLMESLIQGKSMGNDGEEDQRRYIMNATSQNVEEWTQSNKTSKIAHNRVIWYNLTMW